MPRRHEGYGELAVRSIDATSSAQPPPATLKIQQLLIGRWWLTLGVLVSTVLGSIFCLTARHRSMYQSQATIQILPYKAQSLQLESEFRTGHNYDSFMNTQATLLRSRPILTRVLDGLHQDARYDEQTAKWTIDTLAGGVVTEVPRRTQLIKVRFTHPNPQIAQAVVDSVTQIYLESLEQGLIDTMNQAARDQLTAGSDAAPSEVPPPPLTNSPPGVSFRLTTPTVGWQASMEELETDLDNLDVLMSERKFEEAVDAIQRLQLQAGDKT